MKIRLLLPALLLATVASLLLFIHPGDSPESTGRERRLSPAKSESPLEGQGKAPDPQASHTAAAASESKSGKSLFSLNGRRAGWTGRLWSGEQARQTAGEWRAGQEKEITGPPDLRTLTPGQEISVPLPDGRTLTARVNASLPDEAVPNLWIVAAGFPGHPGGFNLYQEGDENPSGRIWLVDETVAWTVEDRGSGGAWIVERRQDEMVCALPAAPPGAGPAGPPPGRAPRDATLPKWNSRSEQTAKVLFLDFCGTGGASVFFPEWPYSNPGTNYTVPAANLSNAEMRSMFVVVAEDFAPFDINVTTDPAVYAVATVGSRQRCVITRGNGCTPLHADAVNADGTVKSGGYAQFNVFSNAGQLNPGETFTVATRDARRYSSNAVIWVFLEAGGYYSNPPPPEPRVFLPQAAAHAVSHELGHGFGLFHDGFTVGGVTTQYYGGHPATGPTRWCAIMGSYFNSPAVVQWSKGEYTTANNSQDDLAVLTSAPNNLAWLPDESTRAADVQGFDFSLTGRIQQTADSDDITIEVPEAGEVLVAVAPYVPFNETADPPVNVSEAANLDCGIAVRGPGGVRASAAPDDSLAASITFTAAVPGIYTVTVNGTGRLFTVPAGNWQALGYSNYGSIGSYRLTGTYTDRTPPVVTVAEPAFCAYTESLAAVSGTITDRGAGAGRVFVALQRKSDGKFYQPASNTWTANTAAEATVALTPVDGQWSMPLPATAVNNVFFLHVNGEDTQGNRSPVLRHGFRIGPDPVSGIAELGWDPGLTPQGTVSRPEGAVYDPCGDLFLVRPQDPLLGAWRLILNVRGTARAEIYLRRGEAPTPASFDFASTRETGSQGLLLRRDQFMPGETWYALVVSDPGADWDLVSGDVHVREMGALPFTDANSNGAWDVGESVTAATNGATAIGPEGAFFFKATVPLGTQAWALWLADRSQPLRLRAGGLPWPDSFDLSQQGKMLVVPDTLQPGLQYYLRVDGPPGEAVTLDSRIQTITNVDFSGSRVVTGAASGYGVFRVNMPPQQIGWEVSAAPVSTTMPEFGSLPPDSDLSVRKGTVGNEFIHDAASAVPYLASDSVSLSPPMLTDGTWFVTLWGDGAWNVTLRSGEPLVTPVSYTGTSPNIPPAHMEFKTGWRYYAVTDIGSQTGSLGWELLLHDQPPGTEIALRRNALPSRWQAWNGGGYSEVGAQLDFSSTTGILQRPGHQADIWYIGIYTPDDVLGRFTLERRLISPTLRPFDSAAVETVSNQPANGAWRFFRFDVPSSASLLGWDLRVKNVTGGAATVMLQKDTLPGAPGGSGTRGLGTDWTGYALDSAAVTHHGTVIARDATLTPGTWYLGVLANGTSISYGVQSRGIGTGFSLPVGTLANANGSTQAITGLAAREAAYYRLTLPAGLASVEILGQTGAGEFALAARRGFLPSIDSLSYWGALNSIGFVANKPGAERFVLLPQAGETTLAAGDYFLAVISQGTAPDESTGIIGSGSVSTTLRQNGPLAVPNIGAVSAVNVSRNITLVPGQVTALEFTVPANTPAMELRLDNVIGDTAYSVTAEPNVALPAPPGFYGWPYYPKADGGQNGLALAGIFTQPQPVAGTYRVLFAAPSLTENASATFTAKLPTVQPLAFAGGTHSVAAQEDGTWRYFEVAVPAVAGGNPLAWDLRLTGLTGGTAQMHIRRDELPPGGDIVTSGNTTWPAGDSYGDPPYDWTGANTSATGEGHLHVVLPMNQPLVPGVYKIGILATGGAISYTMESRSVTAAQVTTLAATTGASQNITALAPWEIRYFKSTVPAGQASWEWTLTPGTGEMLMAVRHGGVPGTAASQTGSAPAGHGVLLRKLDAERFVLLPEQDQTTVTAGDYYFAVVSQGVDPTGGINGTGTSTGTLTTRGPLVVPAMGLAGAAPLTRAFTLAPGQLSAVDFSVPAGAAALQVRLTGTTGHPHFSFFPVSAPAAAPGTIFPAPPDWSSDSYGYDGGWGTTASGASPIATDSLFTVAAPAGGTYRVMLRNNGAEESASGTLEIQVLPVQTVTFNGGTASVTAQPADTWRYFRVDVPTGVAGWDVRVADVVNSGDNSDSVADVVIRRGVLPPGGNYLSGVETAWPAGDTQLVDSDWSGYLRNPGGARQYGAVLPAGAPLEPGFTYFIGVRAAGGVPLSYQVRSFGIGTGMIFPVTPLDPAGSTATIGLAARNGRYYKITIPASQTSWEMQIAPTVGDAALAVARGHIPGHAAHPTLGSIPISGTQEMLRPGSEHYVLLPVDGQTTIPAGDYYVAVIAQGVNAGTESPETIGTSTISANVQSGTLAVAPLGAVTAAGPTAAITLDGGQIKAYTFTVAPNTPLVEVRLDGRTGNPGLALQTDAGLPFTTPFAEYMDTYGYSGGWGAGALHDRRILLFPPPAAGGTFRLLVRAAAGGSGYDPAAATLQLRTKQFEPLAFGPLLSGGGVSHTVTRSLTAGEKLAFRIDVPVNYGGQPVIGWQVQLDASQAGASLAFYQPGTPENRLAAGPGTAVIVPAFLTPGAPHVVEVSAGELAGNITLTSGPVLLKRNPWPMPIAAGQAFADSGSAIPGDGGIDLSQGAWHFYAVDVPEGNPGLLRTQLEAINGNPDLLLRALHVPGLLGGAYERSLQSAGVSETGNWVPQDGRFASQLTPGRWYLAVTATGSNCRYRLKLSTGNVNPLALDGGTTGEQSVVGGDWQYFSVTVPENAPPDWRLEFTRSLGNGLLYLRDTVPPGDTTVSNDPRFRADWATDDKNTAPHFSALAPGSHTFTIEQFRPGHTYYLGVASADDATFSLSSFTGGVPINVPALSWTDGQFTGTLGAAADVFLKATAPPDALFLRYASTHTDDVQITIEEGTLPYAGHYTSTGADSTFFTLLSAEQWPWQPGRTFYIRLRNLIASPQNVTFSLRNIDDDLDDDGFADEWERLHFGSAANPNADPNADPDHDQVPNLLEYALGGDPMQPERPDQDLVTADAQGRLLMSIAKPQEYSLLHVEYIVEVCGTLDCWDTEGLEIVSETSTQLIVRDPVLPGTQDSRFLRLRVVLHP